jgi:lysophospholipase L1-like esterase
MTTAAGSRKPSRLKLLAMGCAVAAVLCLLLLMLAELVLSFAGFGNVEIYQPDPVLYWRLKPGQQCFTKVNHEPVRVNSHGTRGAEFTVPKPPGTYRVLMLGDSRTFGWGLKEEATYCGLVESGLREMLGEQARVEVINAGVNAWSYPQMLLFLRERALAWEPDVVVLAGANLWTQFTENASPEFVRQFMSRVRLKNLLRRSALYHFVIEVQLEAYYQRYRTKFIPVDPKSDTLFLEQQKADPDAVFRKAIEDICAVTTAKGIRPVLLYLPTQTELQEGKPGNNLRQIFAETSEKTGAAMVDTTAELSPEARTTYLEADPVHLNAAGNAIVARKLIPVLLPSAR